MNHSIEKNDWKQNWIVLIILPIIVVTCFWIWYVRVDTVDEVRVVSETPDWYLEGYDFDEVYVWTRGSIAEYVPEQLLTPAEFEQADYITGKPKNAAQYLTARFRLHVPDGRVYTLASDSVDFADRIFINGQLYQEVGRPAQNREEMVPSKRQVHFTVLPENGVIEIVQQISNFVHRDGGNPVGFRIGSPETAGRYYDRTTSMAALVMGACLLLFLVHLALYLMQRSYKANLFFSLFCLVWFFRTAVTGEKMLTILYPDISWELTFHIEYMAMPLACLFITLAVDSMMPGLLQKWARRVIIIVETGFTLLFAFADTLFMSNVLIVSHAAIVMVAVYVIIRFIMQLRVRRDTEHIIFFAAMLVFVYIAVREMLMHNRISIFPTVPGGMMDFGILVFILFQMVAAFYGTMREVRQARERERQIAAEKDSLEHAHQMKQELMANLTHEMRTPLTVMSTYAQLAVRELKKEGFDSRTTEDLDTINQEAKRLAEMASGVLDVFREQTTATANSSAPIAGIVSQTARLYTPIAKKQKNTITIDLPEDLPLARGSADGCTQVMWNILANANAHTENGQISITAKSDGQTISVTITDTGSGIDPVLLPQVLERNVKGEEGGAGLGLSISREIMQSCGGNIEIQSEQGKGTAVTLTFQIFRAEDKND
ncbi:MAG: sensor histidine kinase [Christensenellaceae bacterium]|jgi:signal transduction histidine kinase